LFDFLTRIQFRSNNSISIKFNILKVIERIKLGHIHTNDQTLTAQMIAAAKYIRKVLDLDIQMLIFAILEREF